MEKETRLDQRSVHYLQRRLLSVQNYIIVHPVDIITQELIKWKTVHNVNPIGVSYRVIIRKRCLLMVFMPSTCGLQSSSVIYLLKQKIYMNL